MMRVASDYYIVQPWDCKSKYEVYKSEYRTLSPTFPPTICNPPAPRCGDSDQGIYVGEWMLLRCYGIDNSEKGVLVTKNSLVFIRLLGF